MQFHGISARLFGSPARASVLTLMLQTSGQELTGREVARMAHVSPPRAMEALRVLEREGLCFQRRVGRASLWKLESRHYLAKRLRPLAGLDAAPRKALEEILSRNVKGAEEAYLFGSVAEGRDEWDSDVDLLLVFPDERAKRRWEAGMQRVQDKLSASFTKHLQVIRYTRRDLKRPGARRLVQEARTKGVRLEGST